MAMMYARFFLFPGGAVFGELWLLAADRQGEAR